MNRRAEGNIKKNIINAFGSFGYLSCFLQWFWAIILYFSIIQSLALFFSPDNGEQVEHSSTITFTQPNAIGVVLVGAIVVIMVAITIYALISMPKKIVKTSNKIVHKTAETITPIIIEARHKQNTKKLRIKITSKIVFIAKLLLIFIPLALAVASGLLEKQSIDYLIALVIECWLACFSVVAFAIQYALARLLQVKISEVI